MIILKYNAQGTEHEQQKASKFAIKSQPPTLTPATSSIICLFAQAWIEFIEINLTK